MRVALVADIDPHRASAHPLFVVRTCHALVTAGHTVSLLVPGNASHSTLQAALEQLCVEAAVRCDFALHAIPVVATARGRGRRLSLFLAAAWSWLRRCELCWCFDLHTAWAATSLKLPTVLDLHASVFPEHRVWAARRITRRSALRAVAANSAAQAQALQAQGIPAEKLLVAHNAADIDETLLGEDRAVLRRSLHLPPGPLAVYAGSLYRGRGVEEILETARGMPDTAFLILGGPRSTAEAHAQTASSSDLINVTFAGPIPSAQVPRHLRAADVLLAPYRADCEDISGAHTIAFASPMKLFEYLAAGRPIVASNIGAIAEILTHESNALLVPPGDSAALAAAVTRVLQDPTLANELGAQALASVRNRTWAARNAAILARV